ncbi:MAG: hypothetical protein ABL921_17445 [Pirellula sp.]
MQIRIKLTAQLRRLAQLNYFDLDLESTTSVDHMVQMVANQGTEELRQALLDESRVVRSSILVFVNNELANLSQPAEWTEQTDVVLTTLVSGG